MKTRLEFVFDESMSQSSINLIKTILAESLGYNVEITFLEELE